MSTRENSKLTVVGAGSVGASVAYAALIRGSARHVALYDIAAERVEAEVLDLAHGTQFTGASEISGGSDLRVAEGSHVVVITAGAKQRPGQSRTDLAGVNAGIIESMMPGLLEVAPDAVYLLVTNPCDVMTVMPPASPACRARASSPPALCSTRRASAGSSRAAPASPPAACTPTSSASTATPSSRCGTRP